MPTVTRVVSLLVNLVCLPVILATGNPAAPTETVGGSVPTHPSPETEPPESVRPRPQDPAVEKFWQALKLLRSVKREELAAGRAALQTSADLEFTHAQVLLGNCLISGSYGFAKNAPKGANLFRLAAERGNGFAKVSFGQCLFTGSGVSKDVTKAAEWLTAALADDADFSRPPPPADFFSESAGTGGSVADELDHDPVADAQATAHFLLGRISTQEKKIALAQMHYVAAATAGPGGRDGIYLAALQAALNYAFGYGTARDLAKAHAMLDQSRQLAGRMGVSLVHNYVALKMVDEFATADLEESVAKAGEAYETELQVKIAATFADKKSKDYNLAEAVKWYELAAESGQPWAMLSLAFIYSHGDLGAPDPVKAFQGFEKVGGGEKPRHYLGVANLAICWQNGIGTGKDLARASALFRKNRDADVVCYLGSIAQCPDHIVTFDEELRLNEKWAKEEHDAHAAYLLGNRYLNGFGVKPDFGEAVKWYQLAAKAGDAAGQNQMGYLYSVRWRNLGCATVGEAFKIEIKYYSKAATNGSAAALYNLGQMAETGHGLPQDLDKATAYYEHCLQLEPNFGDALNNSARIQMVKLTRAKQQGLIGISYSEAVPAVLQHLDTADKLGNRFAPYNLGCIYSEGILCQKDLQKAYGYFETAAERGLALSHWRVGQMLERGEGVPVSLSEAAYHYRLAALDGNMDALRRLVNFYLTGQGVDMDLDRATFWLNQMVRRGDLGALVSLADLMIKREQHAAALKLLRQLSNVNQPVVAGYACERLSRYFASGVGVTADPKKAKKYFDLAVEYGNGAALTRLGMQQMAAKNPTEALRNFERAANSSPQASYYLGQMYYFGTNVEKDEAKALRLMRNAADGNQPEALYFLAALTFDGAAGAPSLDDAIRFAQRAETGGLDKARPLREKLELRRQGTASPPEVTTPARSS